MDLYSTLGSVCILQQFKIINDQVIKVEMILKGMSENTSISNQPPDTITTHLTDVHIILLLCPLQIQQLQDGGGGSQLVNILCCPLLLEIVLLIMTGGGH